MTSSAASAAVVAAALSGAAELVGEKTSVGPVAIGGRRNTLTKSGISRAMLAASLPIEQAGSLSVPSKEAEVQSKDGNLDTLESAIDDDPLETLADDPETQSQDGRMRRASDSQPLVKEGGSRKINRVELRCDKCGKGYKHSSCLTKHLFVPRSPPYPTPRWPLACAAGEAATAAGRPYSLIV